MVVSTHLLVSTMTHIDLLVSEAGAGTGRGNQLTEADGAALDYLAMPKGMQTYNPPFPQRARRSPG